MRMPARDEIHRKVKFSCGLLEAAGEIKRHRLRKKHPAASERELTRLTMELIERGVR